MPPLYSTRDGHSSLKHHKIDHEPHWAFPRVWAAFLLILIAVTFRLWVVQVDVPPVAMFFWAIPPRPWIGWLPLVAIVLSAGMIALDPIRFRIAWWFVAVGLIASFLIDQHRLQPWAYQTAIYATVFASTRPNAAKKWLIPLAASVYIYSALGKLDYQFVHTVGQDFLDVILRPLGMSDSLDVVTRHRLACLFPLTELVVGALLLLKSTRRWAGLLVMGLHGSLLLILGPLGLHHSLGVLTWNLALMVQAWFLFVRGHSDQRDDNRVLYRSLFRLSLRHQSDPSRRLGPGRMIAMGTIVVALIAPATERAGLWDHWPSWALYSPHNSRVVVEIHQSAVSQLPPLVQSHVRPNQDGDQWQRLALDRWSLEALAVPVYPQARYQLALSYTLAERSGIATTAIRARVLGVSNRMTGERSERWLLGTMEMREALEDYWLVGM
ncbi:MAG: hypothetical protein HKN47_05620 [Pirellulaceae bacterium]|nr:hypothetical protein [Pirellulaceae bacterium]